MLTILFAVCWQAVIGYPVMALIPLEPPGGYDFSYEGDLH